MFMLSVHSPHAVACLRAGTHGITKNQEPQDSPARQRGSGRLRARRGPQRAPARSASSRPPSFAFVCFIVRLFCCIVVWVRRRRRGRGGGGSVVCFSLAPSRRWRWVVGDGGAEIDGARSLSVLLFCLRQRTRRRRTWRSRRRRRDEVTDLTMIRRPHLGGDEEELIRQRRRRAHDRAERHAREDVHVVHLRPPPGVPHAGYQRTKTPLPLVSRTTTSRAEPARAVVSSRRPPRAKPSHHKQRGTARGGGAATTTMAATTARFFARAPGPGGASVRRRL